MEAGAFIILCILLVVFLEKLGVIVMVCLVLYNCTGDDPKIKRVNKPVQVQREAPKAPHYEYIEHPQEGDSVCEDGYNLMVDTHTGNKACILGANYY